MRRPPATGAWRPGDDPGRRQFVAHRRRPPVHPRRRRPPPRRRHRLRDVGHARPGRRQRRARVPRLDGRQPRNGHRRSPAGARRAGGRASSAPASPSTPTGTSSCAPTSSAAARARPARRRPIPTTAGPTGRASRSSPSATWCGCRAAGRPPRRRPLAQRRRRVDGRHAGARVGDHVPASGCARSSRCARAPRPPPSRSRGRPSAAGPSASTRAGGAATTTTPSPATARTTAWPSPARSPRSPSAPTRSSPTASTASLADADTEPLDLWQRFEVERYLEYHGDKLVRRFDANSLPRAGQGDGPPRRGARTRTARCAAGRRRSRTCRRTGTRRCPPVASEPLGILLLSGAHDRAHYAFVLASGAAALGRQVVLFADQRRLPRAVHRLVGPERRGARCPRARRWRGGVGRATGGIPRDGRAADRMRGGPACRGAGSGAADAWRGGGRRGDVPVIGRHGAGHRDLINAPAVMYGRPPFGKRQLT